MRIRTFAFRLFTFVGFSSFLFSGCSTDFDPNADYKEVMVLYSLLNPADSVHYVKVNKAFLNTNADARNIAATTPDSITYKDADLKVTLQRLNADSVVLNTYPLERFVSTNKEAGEFFGPNQVLYRTLPNQPGKLDENAIYRVIANNVKSGLTASGATPMVKQNNSNRPKRFAVFQVSIGFSANPTLDEQPGVAYEPEKPNNRVQFRAPENGAIYTVKLTFNYTETDGTTPVNKQISWYLRQNFLDDAPEISFNIDNLSFYNNLLNQINTSQDKPTTSRTAGDIFVTITAGSESLATNYLVSNSFSIFSQVRPEWDNIKNGTGLVGSRIQKSVKARLSQQAVDFLKNDPRYQNLKFK